MRYILDSCALISYILGEEEALKVKDLLSDSSHIFYLNYVNYGEVIFTLGKKGLSEQILSQTKENLKSYLGLEFLKTDDFEIIETAAKYKIGGGLSYFDALILANSLKHGLKIITKDSEFKKFSKEFDILFL
jgi:predicted nucleic acid-binding protein